MSIQELPLELFQQVIVEAFGHGGRFESDNSNCNTQKHLDFWGNIIGLAQVHAAFETEVFRLLVESKFFVNKDCGLWPDFFKHPDAAAFLSSFILRRPSGSYDEALFNFPSLLNRVVDRIIELEGLTGTAEQHRPGFIKLLCENVTASSLDQKYFDTCVYRPFESHVLVASIYLKRMDTANKLLSYCYNLPTTFSDFWRYPLDAAIHIEDVDLIKRLLRRRVYLQYYHLHESPRSYLEDAVRTSKALEIITVLLDAGDKRLPIVDPAPGNAVYLAIELGKMDVANLILEPYDIDLANGYHLTAARSLACELGHRDIVRRILNISGYFIDTSEKQIAKRMELAQRACAGGHEITLQVLLERGREMDAQRAWMDYVLRAIPQGHVGIIRILIFGGVIPETLPLGVKESFKILCQAARHPRSTAVLEFLLEHKVIDVHQLCETDIHMLAPCIVKAAEAGNIEFLKTMARYEVPLDDKEYYTRAGYPLPMIVAKINHQARTTMALVQLGAADVSIKWSVSLS